MEATRYVPEYCVWELTLRCNMRCIHCGSSAGRPRENELSIQECLPTADELVSLGCRHVTLIGGEVLLVPGWSLLARRLAEAGLVVNIITNGSLMDDRCVAAIRTAGLSNVCVSIDGLQEAHDRIRRAPGSFVRACRALSRLRDEGISTGVVTTLLANNVDDLEELHNVLLELGVEVWQLQIGTPMGSLSDCRDLLLRHDQVPRITGFIRQRRDARRLWILAGDDIGYFDANEPYLRNLPGVLGSWSGCAAGLRAVGIDSVGNVKGCESLYDPRFIEGNVRTESLATIWTKEGNFGYNRKFDESMLTGKCAGCDRGARCRGGCRGSCYFTAEGMYENPYCSYPKTRRAMAALSIDGFNDASNSD